MPAARVTAIEINGTFYGSQKPASFRRWAARRRTISCSRSRGRASPPIAACWRRPANRSTRFFGSGVLELEHKLGPVLWQLPPTKAFDAEDFAAFLALLPQSLEGRAIRHAVEVRHASFCVPEFVALMREFSVAIVLIDSDKHPLIADVTADFVYARLQRTSEAIDTGYAAADLESWAKRARAWEAGGAPADLSTLAPAAGKKARRDVFIYLISGAKVRAPAAAQALLAALK